MTTNDRGFRLPFLDRIPRASYDVDIAPDTGGFLRVDWRPQDPAKDPREPWSGESSSAGNDHGWSNCTMASAAMAYALDAGKQSGPWGGDFRHNQGDQSGGTDLYDAKEAWQNYGGRTLTIKNGTGWDDVERAYSEGRPIIIQGEGNVPGSESFDGGHACVISPEPHSAGNWLFGDPLASGWQWVAPSQIKTWAQALSSGICFAVGSIMGSGDSDDMPGIQLTMVEPYAGEAVVHGAGHSWIRIWDGHWGAAAEGFTKRVFARARTKTAITTPGGGTLQGNMPCVIIGDDLAILFEADVTLTPDDNASGEYELVENLYVKKT